MNIYCDTTRYLYEVFEKGEYSYLFDNLTILDVGCNIGAFSFWIYPRAEIIHAIDLSYDNIANLNQTIKANNLDRIKTYCCAISAKDGTRTATVADFPGDGSGMLIESNTGNKKTFEVDSFSLNSFMSKNSISRADILKLDVEGAEYEILQAEDFPKIPTIIGEWHINSLGDIFHKLNYSYKEWGSHFIARL